MDLEVKGVVASPQRQTQQSLMGKKHQGWRPDRQATHGSRPPEVPCLDLGRLRDSDGEDGDSYIPYSRSYPHTCPLESSSGWRTSLQTPNAQHQQTQQSSVLEQKTIPENLPSPRDRYKMKYLQYEADMKEEYQKYSRRIEEKKKEHLKCPAASIKDEHGDDLTALDKKALLQQHYTSKPQHSIRKSEAEDDAAERRKQAVVEQVMVDQLSRAVISDPEQSTRADVHKEAQGLWGLGTAPMRFRKRTLHETKIRTKSGLTENMLSNKLRFDSRIITRNGHDACRELLGFFFACDRSLTVYEFRQFGKNRKNALPFIQKGVYQHQRGQKKGKAYDLSDFYIGANLTFRSVDHSLPESVKQNPILTLRVITIDEAAMDFLKGNLLCFSLCPLSAGLSLGCTKQSLSQSSLLFPVRTSVEFKQEPSKQVVDECEVFRKIQGILREPLRKRGVRVITGLGKYFRHVDKNRSGFLSQADFKEALKIFHLEIPEEDFESLWVILDDSKSDKVNYGEFTRAVFGEMNEYRKAFVRKAYMKLDFNKTGSVPMVDIRKCYCAKKHPLVLAGKATEEEIKSSFLETLGESCSNPNEVSYSEFEDYYEGLSIGIMDDDDFVNILRNPWGI
ncbi:calcyphosin-2 isoform X2 [Apus apus]|uniref:calcyphosin-2 isoform X2 n=1 Tax=Apus apus TaxID=8895 RepID=UPI0021F8742A|nr:calcyphosin-2 isoform X2 [Apus apus]